MDRKFVLMCDFANLPEHWSEEQKASTLAQGAIETGVADLPNIYEVTPGEYDRAVEDAFDFFKGEAYRYLKGER